MINELTEAILLARQDPGQLSRIASLSQSIPDMPNEEIDELLDRLLDFGDELRTARSDEHNATGSPASKSNPTIYFDQLLQPAEFVR